MKTGPNNFLLSCAVLDQCSIGLRDYYFIIIIVAKISDTITQKCTRGTVHKSLSQVGHWSNVSYTAAAAAAQLGLCLVVLKRRIEQQRLQIAPECQMSYLTEFTEQWRHAL